MGGLGAGSTTAGGLAVSPGGSPTALVDAQPLNKINKTAIDPTTVADRERLAVLIRLLCTFCYA
jgi:hypothetical protein